jgi:SAM-dependent methyltransferase
MLSLLDKKGQGLEIGPSHNPLAPKKQGFNVHILDLCNAEDLRAKFQGEEVNLDDIEEVDYVWHGEPLHELIGHEQCYDWILASHVIEHAPDLISFLSECERLLKPTGMLSLAIPDKRYCFDYFHGTTSTGEFLDAFEQKRNRPSPGKVFDHCARAAKSNGQVTWGPHGRGVLEFMFEFSDAYRYWHLSRTTDTYVDVHNWRFTPSSFRLLLDDLRALDLTGFEIKKEFDTAGCEFFVTLAKCENVSIQEGTNRMEILKQVKADEQSTS